MSRGISIGNRVCCLRKEGVKLYKNLRKKDLQKPSVAGKNEKKRQKTVNLHIDSMLSGMYKKKVTLSRQENQEAFRRPAGTRRNGFGIYFKQSAFRRRHGHGRLFGIHGQRAA